MRVYILRYYDWDCEQGETLEVFSSLTNMFSYLVSEYEGRVDIEKVQSIAQDKFYISVDEDDYGKCLLVERKELI
jgi:hypothetical protein|nr:MAG TPA: hypothetical protein [Caudoviricetes sp.]